MELLCGQFSHLGENGGGNVVQRGVWDMCLGWIPWVGEGREAIIAFPKSFLRSLPIELLRLHSWHSGWNIIDHTFGC